MDLGLSIGVLGVFGLRLQDLEVMTSADRVAAAARVDFSIQHRMDAQHCDNGRAMAIKQRQCCQSWVLHE